MKNKLAFILCGMAMLVYDKTFALPWYGDLEFSLAGGPNWINVLNSHLVITSFETDSNRVNSVSNQIGWKVGAGYFLFEDYFLSRCYLNHLLFEMNLYRVSGNFQGDVWQYELPQFNNFSFSSSFRSTRLMFDIKPYLFTWRQISPYFILGIGQAWNTVSYHETVTADDVPGNSALSLSEQTTTKFAEEIGVGLSMKLTCWLDATAEYIFASLKNGSPAGEPTNGIPLADTPSFQFYTQSFLLGLSVKL
jgi:hypothetical protein